jgi:hypothetical protein
MNYCTRCCFMYKGEHQALDRCYCMDENAPEGGGKSRADELRKKAYHRQYSKLFEKTRDSRKGERNQEKLEYYHTVYRPIVLSKYPTVGKLKAQLRYEAIGKHRARHTYIYNAWAKKMRNCLCSEASPHASPPSGGISCEEEEEEE